MGLHGDDFLGRIEVSPEVIAVLAEEATLRCYGIVGLASRRQRGIWAHTPATQESGGVVVHMEADQVILDLYVVIEYGTRICEVARNVMVNVKFAVEQALGVPVQQVNVNVQGIHIGGLES